MKNKAKRGLIYLSLIVATGFIGCTESDTGNLDIENLPAVTGYPLVGTNQSTAFDNSTFISTPAAGDAFFGQNANYPGTSQHYVDNGDGTVTDMVTGLMWQQTLDHNGDGLINIDDKLTYQEILDLPDTVSTGGYTDWRVPTIKEQYSLMDFSGRDISGYEGTSTEDLLPFINTSVFGYNYGDINAGERLIDVQCASTNTSVGNAIEMVFGVNFADGRIKGYGTTMMGEAKVFNYLLVRGKTDYGQNSFSDNWDGTISDDATGLMWMQDDSETGMNWEDALSYAEGMEYAGYSDWRLPDIKELQSILDYSRSPQSTGSAAIDPVFNCTEITNKAGESDFPYYWSSTTHANWTDGNEGAWAAYLAFGRAMGNESMSSAIPGGETPPDGAVPGGETPPDGAVPDGETPPDGATDPMGGGQTDSQMIIWTDVHGAGAQRSDPKAGSASEYPAGNGPQGDAVRILNHVRLVRNI